MLSGSTCPVPGGIRTSVSGMGGKHANKDAKASLENESEVYMHSSISWLPLHTEGIESDTQEG